MQAITTKILPATSTRDTLVQAKCKTSRISYPYNHQISEEANHKVVARELAEHLQWRGEWVTGQTHDGCYVHVWASAAREWEKFDV